MENTMSRDLSTVPKWVASAQRSQTDAMRRGPNWATIDLFKFRALRENQEKDDKNTDASLEESNLRPLLVSNDVDTTIEVLELVEDVPNDDDWEALGAKFGAVEWLMVEAGFNEDWTDGKFPLHWPLGTLVVASACGHPVTTPAILDGQVPHLVLLLTCNLRFEGPTNDELSAMDELEDPTVQEEERERKMKIVYIPGRVSKWMFNKYQHGVQFPSYEGHESKPPSRMHTLEILENDAIDTFSRFALASGHVVDKLERLNLRSTSGLDFGISPEDMFPVMLGALKNLKELELSLSSKTFDDPDLLMNLYKSFPPNSESLKFRGPPSLALPERFGGWVKAFGQEDYLPKLKKLSFVLDVVDKKADKDNADVIGLEPAKDVVASFLNVARARNVVVEDFEDPWTEMQCFQRS